MSGIYQEMGSFREKLVEQQDLKIKFAALCVIHVSVQQLQMFIIYHMAQFYVII